jgi:nascent polypeptide-associated complex subunit beta
MPPKETKAPASTQPPKAAAPVHEGPKVVITKEMLAQRAAMVRTGGKGSVRRTVKAQHKSTGEDKKVTGTLKRLGVTPVSEIEEATMFRTDGTAFYFKNPKVQASMQSQCFSITGNYDTKSLQEMLPQLASQLQAAVESKKAESAAAAATAIPTAA